MARGRRAEGFPSHIVYLQPLRKKKKRRIYKVVTYGRTVTLKSKIPGIKQKRIKIKDDKTIPLSSLQKYCMKKHLGDEIELDGIIYFISKITKL